MKFMIIPFLPQRIMQYVYVSTATDLAIKTLKDIGLNAQSFNKKNQITGILIQTEGEYMQILEGPENTLKKLYEKIEKDPRHKWVTLLEAKKIYRRTFGEWTMAIANVDKAKLPTDIFMNNDWNSIKKQMQDNAFSKKFTGFFETFYSIHIDKGRDCRLIEDIG